jgi:hypothetical protein
MTTPKILMFVSNEEPLMELCPKCGEEMYARCEPDHEGGCYYDEDKLDDNIIGLVAELQQSGFERGEHLKEWCDEAEEQFRELLKIVPFEGKQQLQLKLSQDLLAREAEMPELIPISAQ